MNNKPTHASRLGIALLSNKLVQLGELIAVFVVALAVIKGAEPYVGDNRIVRHGVGLLANVLMLATVWLGLRLRGQNWAHFGLSFRLANMRTVVRTVLLSIVVFVAAMAAFIVGAVIMANIMSIPENADWSAYNYLQGNLPMLLIALVAVFIVSSFGEEVIYRAFLINRIAELGSSNKTSWRLAVVISSIIFSIVHFEWGITGMVQTGFMGLALGIAYLFVKRNLWVTILAHAYMDAILILQMYFATS